MPDVLLFFFVITFLLFCCLFVESVICFFKTIDVHLDGEDPDRLVRSFDCDSVDLTADLSDLWRQHEVEEVRDEDVDTVLLRRSLQTGRHIHVRRQVGGIDLEEGADRTFNRPTLVQSEAHFHFVIVNSSLKAGLLSVLKDVRILVDLCDDFEEAEQRHVCDLTVVKRDLKVLNWLPRFEFFWLLEFPHHKKRFTQVFVG